MKVQILMRVFDDCMKIKKLLTKKRGKGLESVHGQFMQTCTKIFSTYKLALRGERFAFLIVFAFDRARGKTLQT